MSGIVLALGIFALTLLAHLGFSHVVETEKKERALVWFMVAAGVTYIGVAVARPEKAIGLAVVPWMTDFLTGWPGSDFSSLAMWSSGRSWSEVFPFGSCGS